MFLFFFVFVFLFVCYVGVFFPVLLFFLFFFGSKEEFLFGRERLFVKQFFPKWVD